MRFVAMFLIVVGALAMAYQAFPFLGQALVASASTSAAPFADPQTSWLLPLVGGIAVTSGLIVLAVERKA